MHTRMKDLGNALKAAAKGFTNAFAPSRYKAGAREGPGSCGRSFFLAVRQQCCLSEPAGITFLLDMKTPEKPHINLTSLGYSLRKAGKVVAEVCWSDVNEIFAFKQDVFSYDLICLGFRLRDSDTICEVDEECAGYKQLVSELETRFPGLKTDWFAEVAFPAFKTNQTILWTKSDQDDL